MRIAIILASALLSGCSLFQAQPPEMAVGDPFCLRAKEKTFSSEDSAETIRDVEAHNGTIARRCGKKRATS